LSPGEVAGFLNDNAWRYVDALQALKDLLGRYAVTNEGRAVVHSIYSRGHKQRGGHELKACWQIRWKVNHERENGRPGFPIQDLDDIVGLTVVCNFHNQIDDVVGFLRTDPAAQELIRELTPKPPKDASGYRAQHFVAKLRDATYSGVLCEVQIKGVLDDAWARWQHDLTYKPQGPLPENVVERMAMVSNHLRLAGELTESFKDEIEAHWKRDRARQDAQRMLVAHLITEDIPPLAGKRGAEFKSILRELFRNASRYSTGDPGPMLARIEAFALEEFDPHSCWAMIQLAAIRATDDLDFVALDRIDRNVALARDPLERVIVLNIKAIALFLFGQLADAVEVSELALEAALQVAGHPEVVASCQANLAYSLAEFGDKRGAARAKRLVEEFLAASGGEKKLSGGDLHTVGLVKIVFGETREEVEEGLDLCKRGVRRTTPAAAQKIARAFLRLHEQLAKERLERMDADAMRALTDPSYEHSRCFELDAETVLLPIDALRPTTSAKSQPHSVTRARARMREAAAGIRPRRAPIDVRPVGDDIYEIVDGNATYAVAVQAGWRDLPAKVVRAGRSKRAAAR
jgi:ppGpp synthetase/RelA/SpoT-type nucleotidyltranferase